MIPEIIGFGCLKLEIICGKLKKWKKKYQQQGSHFIAEPRLGKLIIKRPVREVISLQNRAYYRSKATSSKQRTHVESNIPFCIISL
jgi:hypothetical protein